MPKSKLEPLPQEPEYLSDPALGELVPRCWNCGRPGMGRRIYSFGLLINGHVMGRWQLCAGCFLERNPQPDPDPLHVA